MTTGRKHTPEEDAWLAEWYMAYTVNDCIEEYERVFGERMSRSALHSWASSRGLTKGTGTVSWADHHEYSDYMREIIPGHSEAEICELFADRFGIVLSPGQIGNSKARLGVKSGTFGGQFTKGHRPANKGKTWAELKFTPEQLKRMRANQYKPGEIPGNASKLPIGSERVTVDGYIEVKVSERSPIPCTNKCWRLKQRVVWEQANGRKLTEDEVVLFADNDKANLDPANLVMATRAENAMLNLLKLEHHDRETTETAVRIAKLKLAIGKREKDERRCTVCGRMFKPEYKQQRRCRSCIDAMGANSRKYKSQKAR